MRSCITLLALLLVTCQAALAADNGKAENLDSMVESAISRNPELKSSRSRWEMFVAKARQAGSLEDPMLMLKLQNMVVSDPLNFGKEAMTSKVIGISQQLPFWGKRALREDLARSEADSYRWTVEERRLELAKMVKEAWYRLYYVDKSLGIIDKNIKILDDFIALAETRYAVNQGAQSDILKAQIGRSRMLDMRITLVQQRASLQSGLNSLLFRPADTTVGTIPEFDLKPVPAGAGDLSDAAYAHRPMLKNLEAQIRKGEAGLRLADREFYPDFNLSFEYMQRDPAMGSSGLDMYSLGVTFNLPVQRERRHAAVAESNSEISMATEELNSLKNSINSGISDLLAQLDQRRKLVELYGTGIILQSEQSLDSAVINYRVGKVDFLTLLDSQMTLFNYERDLFESRAEYMIRLAELEALIGVDPAAVAGKGLDVTEDGTSGRKSPMETSAPSGDL